MEKSIQGTLFSQQSNNVKKRFEPLINLILLNIGIEFYSAPCIIKIIQRYE